MIENVAGHSIAKAFADWVRLCRVALGTRDELAVASPGEVARIARELGVRPPDLANAATGWPASAVLLRRMIKALGVDPDSSVVTDHASIGDLQRQCAECAAKADCARDLARGNATDNFYAYCPNAQALDSIYVESTFKWP
jgi:hypothetical protein